MVAHGLSNNMQDWERVSDDGVKLNFPYLDFIVFSIGFCEVLIHFGTI